MSGEFHALDSAIASFLTRVAADFASRVKDEAAVRETLVSLGYDGTELELIVVYLNTRAGIVRQLVADAEGLVGILASAGPDLTALVESSGRLWSNIEHLAESAPKVSIPTMPNASVLAAVLSQSIDMVLREMSAVAWAFLRAINLIGTDRPLVDVVTEFIASPTGYVWRQLDAKRQNIEISVLGLLTGPRATSVVTVSNADDTELEQVLTAALPGADQVLGRVTFRLAADTFDEPFGITFEAVGRTNAGDIPTFMAVTARTSAGIAEPIRLGESVAFAIHPIDKPLGVALRSGELRPLLADTPSLLLTSTFRSGVRFGSETGLRLELDEPVVEAHSTATSWGARVGLGRLEVVIPNDALGPIFGFLLPRDGITIRGKLIASFDERGINLEGGVGLKATWPDTLRLPGVVVRSLVTEIKTDGPSVSLHASGTVVVELGPVTVVVENLGLAVGLALASGGTGNLGLVNVLAPTLSAPMAVGVSIDAAIVKGGGFLRVKHDEISGTLELALRLGSLDLQVQAVGILDFTGDQVSFVVVMSVEFNPPMELFLGLTLNAVGGVFGLHRTFDQPVLTQLVRSGRVNDIMFPRDLAARAPEVIDAVKAVYPTKPGQFVVGPMLKLGWGRPVSFVTISAGIIVTFPDPSVFIIVGQIRIVLPTETLRLVNVKASFAGGINFSTGEVWFDASLNGSSIGFFDVNGDVALRAGPGGFVFTAGGFHPDFQPPAGLTDLKRLSMGISAGSVLKVQAYAYFALTPSTVQFGGGLHIEAEIGPLGARGGAKFDVLIRTEPRFSFSVSFEAYLALLLFGAEILSLDVSVLLEGPGRWHVRAHASVKILFFRISGTIDVAWGAEPPVPLDPIDVAAKVKAALAADTVWTCVLPARDAGVVQLRRGAEGLHPLGSLRVTQTVAPLGVSLLRYGTNPVMSTDPIKVRITAPGITPLESTEMFAPAQFFELTDEERWSKPSFAPYLAGYRITGSTWLPASDPPLTVEVVYEESLGDEDPTLERFFSLLTIEKVGWAVRGAAGRMHEAFFDAPTSRGYAVRDTVYLVADATTGALAAPAVLGSLDVHGFSKRHSADYTVIADYERVG